jgi:hypothetical protein
MRPPRHSNMLLWGRRRVCRSWLFISNTRKYYKWSFTPLLYLLPIQGVVMEAFKCRLPPCFWSLLCFSFLFLRLLCRRTGSSARLRWSLTQLNPKTITGCFVSSPSCLCQLKLAHNNIQSSMVNFPCNGIKCIPKPRLKLSCFAC